MKFPLKKQQIGGYKLGEKTWYGVPHKGNDYKANFDFLYAPENGIIIFQQGGYQGGYWLHYLGDSGYLHKFAHLYKYLKEKDKKCQEGDKIAITGNSGVYTKGAHLHYEVWEKDVQFDPEIIFKNNIMKLLGDRKTKNQFALGYDGKIRLIYNLASLNEGHDAGIWNKNEVEWKDTLDHPRGKDIILISND